MASPLDVLGMTHVADDSGMEYTVSSRGLPCDTVAVSGEGTILLTVKDNADTAEVKAAIDNLTVLEKSIVEEGPGLIDLVPKMNEPRCTHSPLYEDALGYFVASRNNSGMAYKTVRHLFDILPAGTTLWMENARGIKLHEWGIRPPDNSLPDGTCVWKVR